MLAWSAQSTELLAWLGHGTARPSMNSAGPSTSWSRARLATEEEAIRCGSRARMKAWATQWRLSEDVGTGNQATETERRLVVEAWCGGRARTAVLATECGRGKERERVDGEKRKGKMLVDFI